MGQPKPCLSPAPPAPWLLTKLSLREASSSSGATTECSLILGLDSTPSHNDGFDDQRIFQKSLNLILIPHHSHHGQMNDYQMTLDSI